MKRRQDFVLSFKNCTSEISIKTKGNGSNYRSDIIDGRHHGLADVIYKALAKNYHFSQIKVK